MKVIVTGSEGFIGKALTAALTAMWADVICVDRKTGNEVADYFETYDLDDVDCVFHLAAQTSVFNDNLTQIRQDNIDSFMAVCNACKRAGVKLVYASSSTANPGNTTSLYGISKHFNEEYARCYYPEATGVRFHNVYGPNPRQGTLLWYMLNQDHVKLYNLGLNERHFTYIDDIVECLLYAASCNQRLINAANPQSTTTLELARIVRDYKRLDIELVAAERDLDRKEQTVNEGIFTVPLRYTTVEEGIRKIFEDGKTQ